MGLFNKIFGAKTEEEEAAEAAAEQDASSEAKTKNEPEKQPAQKSGAEAADTKAGKDEPVAAKKQPVSAATTRGLSRESANDTKAAKDAPPPVAKNAEAAKGSAEVAKSSGASGAASKAHEPSRAPDTKASSTASGARAPTTGTAKAAAPKAAPTKASPSSTSKLSAERKPVAKPSARTPGSAWSARKSTAGTPKESATTAKAETVKTETAEAKPAAPEPKPVVASKPDRATQLRTLTERGKSHAAHLEQFAMDLQLGCAPRAWADACQPAVAALDKVASELELGDLHAAFTSFEQKLQRLGESSNGHLDPKASAEVLGAYERLAALWQEGLRKPADAAEREPMLLDAVLRQVEGLHSLSIDKIREAGLLSLQALAECDAQVLAERADLDPSLAQSVVSRMQELREGHGQAQAGEARSHLVSQAQAALKALSSAHERFVRAEENEDSKGKREARRDRDVQLLALRSLFVQLGALDDARELERGSLPQRIERARALVAQWG